MPRRISPRTTLDGLKKEAKRWLKALRAQDVIARARLSRALGDIVTDPTLRQVQHALAREHDLPGWTALATAVAAMRTRDAIGVERAALDQLLRAAQRGDLDTVAATLDAHPALVNQRGAVSNSGLRTALHVAVGGSHEQVIKALLDRGADPNVRDQGDDAIPLHFAAEKGHWPIIRMLIEHGSDPVAAGDMHGLEVIGWATVFGAANPEIVDYLLAHGARHNIFSAVATGALEHIRACVDVDHTALDRVMDRANLHRHPLHLAVVKKQPASLAVLLELGADTAAHDAAHLTPLDQAALDGEPDMARQLIEHGARMTLPAAVALGRTQDVTRVLRDEPGMLAPGARFGTLLIRAAERAPAAVIDALVRAGSSVQVEDDEATSVDRTLGYTALHAAAFSGNVEAVRALLGHGADVTARDTRYSGTPVGWAQYAGRREVLDLLLDAPIDIFDAIEHDRLDRVRAIAESDPPAVNRPFGELLRPAPPPPYGHYCEPWWTPLSFAAARRKTTAVLLLGELGATRNTKVVQRFLDNACPDHHVRGGPDHVRARSTALRLLERHPEIASTDFNTAVVCGALSAVIRYVSSHPELVKRTDGTASERRSGPGGSGDLYRGIDLGPKGWEPLLYLCFARLPLESVTEHAVAIARLLLDHGADPNAFFMAGDSRYTPLVGVIGEGEEGRPAQPCRDELVRLLLARGAEPYDKQVLYNMHTGGNVLWFLTLIHARSLQLGRGADWDDPEWTMLDMGGYGSGARWFLDGAIQRGDVALARWCVEHGASPHAAPPPAPRLPKRTLYEEAARRGQMEIAELLVRHGATRAAVTLDGAEAFAALCLDGPRPNEPELRRRLAQHPEFLRSPVALHEAARRDRADIVELLLDLGVSPDVGDARLDRALHQAAYHNATKVAELLVARGAEIDPVGQWGNTPLGAAVYAQHPEMIDLLARYSRDVWELTYAGKIERLREILAERSEYARVTSGAHTLLMWLPPQDETLALETAKLLLANGADPTLRNDDGMAAADRAEALGMFEVATLLRHAVSEAGERGSR